MERIARDSERDHWVIMEVLTTYVREHSPRKKKDDPKAQKTPQPPEHKYWRVVPQEDGPRIGADIQAILTVLGRREPKYDKGRLNLRSTSLRGAYLSGADLRTGG